MSRDKIVNWLILFYGMVAGVCAFLLLCGLLFGWVIVPEQAQTEFWRLVILVIVVVGPLITNELRTRYSRGLERKIEQGRNENATQIDDLSTRIDGRLSQLLNVTSESQLAKGVLQGHAEGMVQERADRKQIDDAKEAH